MQYLQRRSAKGVYLALLCLFFVILPLFAGPGPVNTRGGGDSPFLLVRLEQLVAGLRSGAFPVRWMPDAAYGLGYPFFNFYASLPYWLAAGLRLVGWGPISALQVIQALGFLLSAASMALLARRVFRHPAAVTLAAVAYTCAPFHMVNVYVRGDSLSEFYAFVFYPLIFWSLLYLDERPSWAGMSYLALSYGGLVLTHNLSALMFSPFVIVFALWLWVGGRRSRRRNWRTLAWMFGGGVLGLALSATLWLTAAQELDLVWMGVKDIQTSGYFGYSGHFRSLLPFAEWPSLVQPRFLFHYELSPENTPFAMGVLQAAAIMGAIVAWGIRQALDRQALDRREPRQQTSEKHPRPAGLTLFWLGGFALSTFMITPASRLLWDHLPLLPIVQFPWRFLSVQAFFGALLVGGLAERLPRPWWVALATTTLLTLGALGTLRPEYLPIAERDVTAERLALFESFTTNVGTTIRSEYLPAGVEPGLLASRVTHERGRRPQPMVLAGQISRATLIGRDGRSEQWQVVVESEQARLAFHTLYFAGWRAWLDGERIEVSPLPSSGLISLSVPRGEHGLELRFGRTRVRWVADLVSLLAGLAVLVLLCVSQFAPVPWGAGRVPTWKSLLRVALVTAFVVAALALAGRVIAGKSVPAVDDISMDFDRMPFMHHNPGGIDYGAARLLSYAYERTTRGGGSLAVTSQWSQTADLAIELCLVSPADPLDLAPLPPPLSCAVAHLEEGTELSHALDVPTDAASGRYYVSLRVYGPQEVRANSQEVRAVNARGDTLGTTYLDPVWVDNPRPVRGDERLLARFGPSILLHDSVQVTADGAAWDVRLTWQTTGPVPINYTCSLHVLDAHGGSLAQRDFAEGPGYGFWPTSAWPVGEQWTDRLQIAIPEGVHAEQAAAVSVVLYDRSQPGLPAAGLAVVPVGAPLGGRERCFEVPAVEYPVGATWGERIVLQGIDLAQETTLLRLVLHWQALAGELGEGQVPSDYVVFAHLYDPASEAIAAQSDARPLQGTYPTSSWTANEVVSDEVTLSLAGVSPGRYRLAVGMYEADSRDRVPIVDAEGKAVPDGRLILEPEVVLPMP